MKKSNEDTPVSAWGRIFVSSEGKFSLFEFPIQGHQYKIDEFWFVTGEICREEIVVERLRWTRGSGAAEDGCGLRDEERETAGTWVEEDTEIEKVFLDGREERREIWRIDA